MGISVSILLIAIGAVLTWAVSAEASGIDITAVGVILMVVGVLGFVTSLVFWSSWGGLGAYRGGGGGASSAHTTVVKDD
jgi:hypothetical protein